MEIIALALARALHVTQEFLALLNEEWYQMESSVAKLDDP